MFRNDMRAYIAVAHKVHHGSYEVSPTFKKSMASSQLLSKTIISDCFQKSSTSGFMARACEQDDLE